MFRSKCSQRCSIELKSNHSGNQLFSPNPIFLINEVNVQYSVINMLFSLSNSFRTWKSILRSYTDTTILHSGFLILHIVFFRQVFEKDSFGFYFRFFGNINPTTLRQNFFGKYLFQPILNMGWLKQQYLQQYLLMQ